MEILANAQLVACQEGLAARIMVAVTLRETLAASKRILVVPHQHALAKIVNALKTPVSQVEHAVKKKDAAKRPNEELKCAVEKRLRYSYIFLQI